jgi:hypothetical protein
VHWKGEGKTFIKKDLSPFADSAFRFYLPIPALASNAGRQAGVAVYLKVV